MKTRILGPLVVLGLMLGVQLACLSPDQEDNTEKAMCLRGGGRWHADVLDPVYGGWCEWLTSVPPTADVARPAPETAAAPTETAIPPTDAVTTAGDAAACVLPRETVVWAYVDFERASGTGGVSCNATFVFDNLSTEPIYLVVRQASDNGAMQDDRWRKVSLGPGVDWEAQVSRTDYTNGDVTYSQVIGLLVLRDTPECAPLLRADDAAVWAAAAVALEALSCE